MFFVSYNESAIRLFYGKYKLLPNQTMMSLGSIKLASIIQLLEYFSRILKNGYIINNFNHFTHDQ